MPKPVRGGLLPCPRPFDGQGDKFTGMPDASAATPARNISENSLFFVAVHLIVGRGVLLASTSNGVLLLVLFCL